jgi:hypothetical protein
MKRVLLLATLLASCHAAPDSNPTTGAPARRPVPRAEKPTVTRPNADGTRRPGSFWAIDQTFNLVNMVPEPGTLYRELPPKWTWDDDGIHFDGAGGPSVIPSGKPIFNYRTLRLSIGPPGGSRHPVNFIACNSGYWSMILEPDDYPWPTIPADSPKHEMKVPGGIYTVHLVEGEPIEVDIPGVGTRTFTPWLVESIELPKRE